ncbi:KH domain-containing protein [Bdellovibrio bacteriovorus]|uniref:KH domain-containing protein n=1 Tax=Bdellovibrio TaxID=958 RepID=UPI0035A88B44
MSLKDESSRESVRLILELIIRNIVLSPDETSITFSIKERTTLYEIETIQSDYGRIIGSSGRMITALRTIALSMASVHGFRAIVTLKNEEQFHKRPLTEAD